LPCSWPARCASASCAQHPVATIQHTSPRSFYFITLNPFRCRYFPFMARVTQFIVWAAPSLMRQVALRI
jgi:hypothetical protein